MPDALAQTTDPAPARPPHRARASADQLLEGRPPAASWEALRAILDSGYEVVVHDEAGRKTRGRVSLISQSQVLVVTESGTPLLRLLRPPGNRPFAAGAVTRIDIVDSTWNGTVIGAVVGVGLAFGIARWEERAVSDRNSQKGLGALVFGGLGLAVSSAVGHWLDLSKNAPVYGRPARTPGISFAPALWRDGIGVTARVYF